MMLSPMTTMNPAALLPSSRVHSPAFIRKQNLPTPPPSLADVNDSSSSSSSCSSTSSSSYSTNTPVTSPCDLLNILTDARFRPVFQAIDEIKRRKCRPDLERILKYVSKRSTTTNLTYQREDIVVILDDLLKHGLITKVFHKGGYTIRIKNEKYAKLIENMNICCNQKSPTTIPMNPHEAMAAALATSTMSKPYVLNSNHHTRETPSPEFAVTRAECPTASSADVGQMTKENTLSSTTSNKSSRKRNRSPTSSVANKAKRARKLADPIPSSSPPPPPTEHIFRKPFITNHNLPPVTIEQLLGLRGDIPIVHTWTTEDLIAFFHQQGYDYASVMLARDQIDGKKLYELKREQVFRMSNLKIGKSLKLWNVIDQIQRHNPSSS